MSSSSPFPPLFSDSHQLAQPLPRHSHAIASVGSRILLYGGRDDRQIFSDLWSFSSLTLQWSLIAHLPENLGRFSHSLTPLGQSVLIFGGCPQETSGATLIRVDTTTRAVTRTEVKLPGKVLPVRHTAAAVVVGGVSAAHASSRDERCQDSDSPTAGAPSTGGNRMVVVGGGAFCFAFGSLLSRPLSFPLPMDRSRDLSGESKAPHESSGKPIKSNSNQQCLHQADAETGLWVLAVPRQGAKGWKDELARRGWLDRSRKSAAFAEGRWISLPVNGEGVKGGLVWGEGQKRGGDGKLRGAVTVDGVRWGVTVEDGRFCSNSDIESLLVSSSVAAGTIHSAASPAAPSVPPLSAGDDAVHSEALTSNSRLAASTGATPAADGAPLATTYPAAAPTSADLPPASPGGPATSAAAVTVDSATPVTSHASDAAAAAAAPVSAGAVALLLRLSPSLLSPAPSPPPSPFLRLQAAVSQLLARHNLPISLLQQLPRKWERLSDLVILPAGSLTDEEWGRVGGEELWATVAEAVGGRRVARQVSTRACWGPGFRVLLGAAGSDSCSSTVVFWAV